MDNILRNKLTSVFANLRNEHMRNAAYAAIDVNPNILLNYVPYLPADAMKEKAYRLIRRIPWNC